MTATALSVLSDGVKDDDLEKQFEVPAESLKLVADWLIKQQKTNGRFAETSDIYSRRAQKVKYGHIYLCQNYTKGTFVDRVSAPETGFSLICTSTTSENEFVLVNRILCLKVGALVYKASKLHKFQGYLSISYLF